MKIITESLRLSADKLPESILSTEIILPPPTAEEIVSTSDSRSEELAFQLGIDLKTKKTSQSIKRIDRGERAQDHIHIMVVCGIYVVGFSAIAMFLVLVWHFITPCAFLDAPHLEAIKQILFSGTLGAALSGTAKKYLGFDEKEK